MKIISIMIIKWIQFLIRYGIIQKSSKKNSHQNIIATTFLCVVFRQQIKLASARRSVIFFNTFSSPQLTQNSVTLSNSISIEDFYKYFPIMKIKLHSTLIFACLILLTISTGFQIDVRDARVQNDRDYKVIQFPCAGGSGDYEFEFKNVPQGWFTQNGKIYAPKQKFQNNRYYGLKVGVLDKSAKKILKRSLIFSCNDISFTDCFDADYEIDLSTDEKLTNLVRERVRDEINYRGVVTKPEKTFIRHSFVFPEKEQIERRVNKGDLKWIREIIDAVVESSERCETVADYLEVLISTIKAHISIIQNESTNFKQQILIIQEEINFLRGEINEHKVENVGQLKGRLTNFRSHIQKLKDERIRIQDEIKRHRKECDDHETEIYELKRGPYQSHHAQFTRYQQKVRDVDRQIAELEDRLAVLKRERYEHQSRCDEYKTKCDGFEPEFKRINGLIQRGRGIINDLEYRIPDIDTDIKSHEIKCIDLEEQISHEERSEFFDLKNRLREKEQIYQTKVDQIEQLSITLDAIIEAQAEYETIINEHYYFCYKHPKGDNLPEIHQTDKSDEFINYLENVFGAKPSPNIRARFSGEQVNLKHFSIFSPGWIRIYGVPYSAGYGNNMDVMQTEFSCENIDDAESFSGKIKKITNNVVIVDCQNGEEYTVHLGGCTKLESATKHELPEIGDEISWKGSKRRDSIKKNHYNGHHVTCY